MIDQQVFKTFREIARFKLPAEEAKSSFGYYIDIPNDWESYRCCEELISYLGIHATHSARFNEIISDLGFLSGEERDWAKRYVGVYENIARMLSTTGARVDFKYDIAETLFDWRTILKFIKLPSRILDFGAGCGRQEVYAYLRNPENIYTAIDSTLAAYTVQNLVFSYLDTMNTNYSTQDFLDFQAAAKPFPKIKDAVPGSRFHIPTWLAEENIPEKYYDVMLACHVHNELSGPDFMRLMRVVEKGLAEEGIFYMRSEITVIDPYDYFDAIDLHAIDPVQFLGERDIVPVYSVFKCAFLTTVFARKSSRHYKTAVESNAPETSFTKIRKAKNLSIHAGQNFVKNNLEGVGKLGKKVATIGDVTDYVKLCLQTTDIVGSLKIVFDKFFNKHIYSESHFLDSIDNDKIEEFRKYEPDIIVIYSQRYGEIEQKIKQIFPDKDFSLRRQYWFPLVFLYEISVIKTDKIFSKPIMGTVDLEDCL